MALTSNNTNDPLSPDAREVYDAFNRVGLYREPSFATDRKALASALREAALRLSVWSETESGEDQFLIKQNDLFALAAELDLT
jgi:hypothetical protein